MNESRFLREIRVEVLQDNLSKVLRSRIKTTHLKVALLLVQEQPDWDTLTRWFDLALTLPPEAILPELLK